MQDKGVTNQANFHTIPVTLLLQVGETEMFCGRKLEVASVLLT